MQLKRLIAAAALASTTVVALALPAGAATTAPTDENACTNGHWPAEMQGRPASLAPGAAAGVYLWHSENGWHLFVTHPGTDKAVFTGRIVSSGKIFGVARDTERRDRVKVTRSNKAIAFRFTNYGKLDGIHFRTRCAQKLTVTGSLNGHQLTPDQVFLGSGGVHPPTVPFTIERVH
jgi:hypothetical protein